MKRLIFFDKSLVYIFLFVFFSILCLVLDEPKESVFLILSTSILLIIIKDKEKIIKGKSIYHLIFVLILSYFISVILISTRGYSMNLSTSRNNKDSEGKAVLLVYEGEPRMYSFDKSMTNINKNGAFFSRLFSPFILFENKMYYQKLGKSDYREDTIEVGEELQTFLSEGFKVYVSYLYDTVYVEEALISIANDGYSDVIIAPVFLTDGFNLSILKSRVEKMKLYNLNINVKYIDPLWNSESIVDSYANILEQQINKYDNGNIGIILVGEGQIGYRKDENLKAAREDSMFRNRIRTKLIENLSLNEHKIKTGWFKYLKPDYKDTLRDLLDYSIGEIIIIYTKPSVTDIENTIIYRKVASMNQIPEGIKVTIIDGFLNDLLFINELKNRIEFTNLQKWE